MSDWLKTKVYPSIMTMQETLFLHGVLNISEASASECYMTTSKLAFLFDALYILKLIFMVVFMLAVYNLNIDLLEIRHLFYFYCFYFSLCNIYYL